MNDKLFYYGGLLCKENFIKKENDMTTSLKDRVEEVRMEHLTKLWLEHLEECYRLYKKKRIYTAIDLNKLLSASLTVQSMFYKIMFEEITS